MHLYVSKLLSGSIHHYLSGERKEDDMLFFFLLSTNSDAWKILHPQEKKSRQILTLISMFKSCIIKAYICVCVFVNTHICKLQKVFNRVRTLSWSDVRTALFLLAVCANGGAPLRVSQLLLAPPEPGRFKLLRQTLAVLTYEKNSVSRRSHR